MSSALQRQVSKIIESKSRLDNPDILDAINGFPGLSGDPQSHFRHYAASSNSAVDRAKLRNALEAHSVELADKLTTSFGLLKHNLTEIERILSSVSTACNEAAADLQRAKESGVALATKADVLMQQKALIDKQARVVESWLARFKLDHAEEKSIRGDIIDISFFAAMRRLAAMRAECKQVLAGQQQAVGLELLDSLSKLMDEALEKLYRWAAAEIRHLMDGSSSNSSSSIDQPDGPSPSPSADTVGFGLGFGAERGSAGTFLSEALTLLKSNNVYYESCCQELGQARRLTLIKRFIHALTKGSGSTRPIEMSAHDPIKYSSDMLAWIHQSAASERDFFDSLLGVQRGVGGSPSRRAPTSPRDAGADADAADEAGVLRDLLNAALEGACRPLQNRIEQVMVSITSPVVSLRLSNVLELYSSMLAPIVPESSALLSMLASVLDECRQSLARLLKKQADKLRRTQIINPDLRPTRLLEEALGALVELLAAFRSSLVPPAQRAQAVMPLLSAALDPIIEASDALAQKLEVEDSFVFRINVLHSAQVALRPFDFTRSRQETLSLTVESHVLSLSRQLANKLLQRWNLSAQPPEGESPLHSLESTLGSFYGSLLIQGTLETPHCDLVTDAPTRRFIRLRVARIVAETYQLLYQAVASSTSSGDLLHVFKHPPEHVNTLLELDTI